MIAKSGIAILDVLGIGLLRLDDEGLHIVQADVVDPKSHAKMAETVRSAFEQIDGVHVTAREAIRKLPEILMLPETSIRVVEIFDEQPIAASTGEQLY